MHLLHRTLDVMTREADRSDPLMESMVALTEAVEQLAHVALVPVGLADETRMNALVEAMNCARRHRGGSLRYRRRGRSHSR
ncbi:hypothetical protein [Actinoplanes sp. NPDC026623]|uniref:hypothetical protein n=1 Tax=Actinoplanes sp. NPDC026623 TaxID=3155610 RepID=UPI0033E583D7